MLGMKRFSSVRAVAIVALGVTAGCTHDFFGQIGQGGNNSGGAPATTTSGSPTSTVQTTGSQSTTTSGAPTTSVGPTSSSVTTTVAVSSSSGGTAMVDCNGDTCTAPEVCCQEFMMQAAGCGATCNGNEQEFACDGPEDCNPGDVCCHQPMMGGVCAAMCNGQGDVLCHDTNDCGGNACDPYAPFPGFNSCQ